MTRNNKIQDGETTGPTDRAAALRFDAQVDAAPRLVARASGSEAARLISIAKTHGVPVVKDADLSQVVNQLPVGQEIPENLYRVVAALFGLAYRLREKSG